MFAIINPITHEVLEFPITNLKARFPLVSLPKSPGPNNLPDHIVMVSVSEKPVTTLQETATVATPVYDTVSKTWTAGWTVTPLTPEALTVLEQRLYKQVSARIGEMLNNFAKERGYDNIVSLCGYSVSTNPQFQSDAAIGISVRDATWNAVGTFYEEVQTNVRPAPTSIDEILAVIPPMSWV